MQMAAQHSNSHYLRGYRMSWLAALVWSALIVLSLLWNSRNEQARVVELAKAEARANLGKDKAFRLWATSKGGFYIPVSEHTRPNPFLANVPLRDVKTVNGTVMTLFNPATVIKEIGEQFQELSGVQAKITNNVYLNPENAPDAWELKALQRFEQGSQEVAEVSTTEGQEYLRLAHPMKMEPGCLKCHSGHAGGLGGSTGVAIPLEPYRHLAQGAVLNLAGTHGGIWLVGLGLIGFIGRRTRKYELEREAAECELRKLSRAVEVSASAIMIMNAQDEIQYVNEKFCEITGYKAAEVIGQNSGILKSNSANQEFHNTIAETLRNGKEWKGEILNRRKDGTEICCLESLSSITDDAGQITHFVTVMEDISERKQIEETILQLAYFDPLTELPNRRSFYERLEQLAASCRRSGSQMALFYLDLDSFKNINDTMGHGAGDALLKIVAQRLSSCMMRETDVVARLGGDEFAVIIPDTSRDVAATAAHKLVCAARQQLMLGGKLVQPTISVGISMFPDDTNNLDDLAKFADIALYKAKEQGKNTSCFYS
jgi:diguanylate cyclase (GGDEF)-like protein/PAS domain S-box-containing protein